ncbi:MAG: shikimate kinase [Flavobacteriaceae bacterium]
MQQNFYNPNIIILLGYMGCGKSTIGKALSELRNIPFIDLDDVLSKENNCTIPELFSQKGSKAFRQLEYDALLCVLKSTSHCILSLGGGTPCYFDTMQHISKVSPKVFYLNATADELASRLFPVRQGRPLISHLDTQEDLKQFIAKHLFERSPFYTQANYTIDVGEKTVKEVVNSISALI